MKRLILAALVAVVPGVWLAAGAASAQDVQAVCAQVHVDLSDSLYSPGFGKPTMTEWMPIDVPAGVLIEVSATTHDPTHETHPEANAVQQNETVAVELRLADDATLTTGVTGDIPSEVTSAGPFSLGGFGPLEEPVTSFRVLHGSLLGGPADTPNSLHGVGLTVDCQPAPPSTSSTTTSTPTSSTVPSTSTVPSSVPQTTPPSQPTTPSSAVPSEGPELPRTGPANTTAALIGVAMLATGAGAWLVSRRLPEPN